MWSAGHMFGTPDLERSSKNPWRFTLRLQVLASVIQTAWSHSFLSYLTWLNRKVGNIWTAADVNNSLLVCLFVCLEELITVIQNVCLINSFQNRSRDLPDMKQGC
jgi:hypothetical protein